MCVNRPSYDQLYLLYMKVADVGGASGWALGQGDGKSLYPSLALQNLHVRVEIGGGREREAIL